MRAEAKRGLAVRGGQPAGMGQVMRGAVEGGASPAGRHVSGRRRGRAEAKRVRREAAAWRQRQVRAGRLPAELSPSQIAFFVDGDAGGRTKRGDREVATGAARTPRPSSF
jgi:hypothetical protein